MDELVMTDGQGWRGLKGKEYSKNQMTMETGFRYKH